MTEYLQDSVSATSRMQLMLGLRHLFYGIKRPGIRHQLKSEINARPPSSVLRRNQGQVSVIRCKAKLMLGLRHLFYNVIKAKCP